MSKEEEEERNAKDYIRLKLVTLQALAEVKEMKYDLGYSDYLVVACLGAYNHYLDEIRVEGPGNWLSQDHNLEIVLGFIPSKVLATRKNRYWRETLKSYWNQLLEKLDSLMVSNKEYYDLRSKNLENCITCNKNDEPRARCQSINLNIKYRNMSSKDVVIKCLIMNVMWSKSCYGMALYLINIPYPTIITKSKGWPSGKCLFAIRFQEFRVISLSRSQVLIKSNLNAIKNVKCLPVSLQLKFDDDYEVRIDSKRSFEIYQLIRTYKQI